MACDTGAPLGARYKSYDGTCAPGYKNLGLDSGATACGWGICYGSAPTPPPPPANLFVNDLTVKDIGGGWISVSAATTGAGTLVFSIDGVEKERYEIDAVQTGQGTQFKLAPGTYNVMANNKFTTITLSAPAPNPIDDCTIAANLCKKESKCYVGDEAANAPGGCGKGCYTNEDPGIFGECCGGYEKQGNILSGYKCVKPSATPPPPPPKKCSKGLSYTTASIGFLGVGDCDPDYVEGLYPTPLAKACYCNSDAGLTLRNEQAKLGEKEASEAFSLGKLLEMLPTLLMFSVIAMIIGAFRK